MHLPYWANYITTATGSPMRDHRIAVQPDGWEYSAKTGVWWYNLHHYMICEGFPWQPHSRTTVSIAFLDRIGVFGQDRSPYTP